MATRSDVTEHGRPGARDHQLIHRPYRPEDQPAVIALLGECFDAWQGESSEYLWTWKFARNPHGQPRIWVAEDGGRIAGCYILNPVKLQLGETTIKAAQSVDAAVSPDYRGRRIFGNLAREALREATGVGVDIVFAFPVASAYGGQVRLGFTPQFAIPKMYSPLIFPPRRRLSGALTLSELNAFDNRFDIFAERGQPDGISVRCDRDYLQWRYFEHPARKYEAIACVRDGQICGFCVLRLGPTRKKLSQGYIVDLQVLPDDGAAARFLTYHALKRFRSLGAHVAMSWERPFGPEQEALSEFGFSTRYAAAQQWLTRPDYVPQFIAYEHESDSLREAQHSVNGHQAPWMLVPGDLDDI